MIESGNSLPITISFIVSYKLVICPVVKITSKVYFPSYFTEPLTYLKTCDISLSLSN